MKIILKTTFSILVLCFFATPFVFAKNKQSQQMPPTIVSVMKAQIKTWQPSTESVGTLNAMEGIKVTPQVSGQITAIYFKSGKMVHKGDSILQIYPDIIKAQLEKAQAQYKTSFINYQRFSKLAAKGYYDKADLDLKKAEMEGFRADVAQLTAQLSQTSVTAPFSGKLGLRQVSVGDFLSPGDAITTLEAIDPIRVDFTIPEKYITQINLGNKVTAVSRMYPGKTFEGTIYAFNSIIDTNTRTLDMRAKVANPNFQLLPGTFVEVTVKLGNPQKAVILPQNAIVYASDGTYVYLMKEHKAVRTKITLGPQLKDNHMVVEKGLKDGDMVITAGQLKLHNGAPVMTQNEAQQYFKQSQQHK